MNTPPTEAAVLRGTPGEADRTDLAGRNQVINLQAPGTGEPHLGRWNRYVTLAKHLQEQNIASFVTFKPPFPDAQYKYPDEPYSYRDASWNLIYIEIMMHVVEYALEHAKELCGSTTPEARCSPSAWPASSASPTTPSR